MGFNIPNEGDAAYPDQAEPDSGDIEILTRGFARTGVISGCEVAAGGTPGMFVRVAPGTVSVGGIPASVRATTIAQLLASDGDDGDEFGYSVACSADGSVVAVSTRWSDGPGGTYVYSGPNWETETKLAARGYSVACSADGSVVVVGEPVAGAVYIYHGTAWATETKLDGPAGDHFGWSVACSADGSAVVVGRPSEGGAGTDRGAVYVYSGTDWATETKLTASDAIDGDMFGVSVATSSDASVIAVGANAGNGVGVGAAYVYSGTDWATETELTASDGAAGDHFGQWVSISADGSVVAVGVHGSGQRGAVYIYSGTNWATETKLVPSAADYEWDYRTVSISADGSVVLVGFEELGAGENPDPYYPGAVYTCSGTDWGTETKYPPPVVDIADFYLGSGVAISGDGSTLVAGGPQQDDDGPGTAFVWTYNLAISEADATDARFDLIAVDVTGGLSVIEGTPAPNAVFPAIPPDLAVLAAVYIPANATTVEASQIVDKRVLISA